MRNTPHNCVCRQNGATEVLSGEDALLDVVSRPDVDLVISALVGFAGLHPTLRAIEAGKDIALANKETLVVGGSMIMEMVRRTACACCRWTASTAPSFSACREKNPPRRTADPHGLRRTVSASPERRVLPHFTRTGAEPPDLDAWGTRSPSIPPR